MSFGPPFSLSQHRLRPIRDKISKRDLKSLLYAPDQISDNPYYFKTRFRNKVYFSPLNEKKKICEWFSFFISLLLCNYLLRPTEFKGWKNPQIVFIIQRIRLFQYVYKLEAFCICRCNYITMSNPWFQQKISHKISICFVCDKISFAII